MFPTHISYTRCRKPKLQWLSQKTVPHNVIFFENVPAEELLHLKTNKSLSIKIMQGNKIF